MDTVNGFDDLGALSPEVVERVIREEFRRNEASQIAIGLDLREAVDAVLAGRDTDGENEENADIIAFLDQELHCHVFNFSPSRIDVSVGDILEADIQSLHSHDGVQITPFEVEVLPMRRQFLHGRNENMIASLIFDLSDFNRLSLSALREGRQYLCLTLTVNGKPQILVAFLVLGDVA